MSNTVYCNTCLGTTNVGESGVCKCTNPECPVPYHFEVHSTEEDARRAHSGRPSWMPKFYFQPTDDKGLRPPHLWCVAWHNDPVRPFVPQVISELIEPEALRLIQVGLGKDVDSAVSVIDPRGQRIEELEKELPFKCCDYCKAIRSCRTASGDGNKACREFDLQVIDALRDGQTPDNLIAFREFKLREEKVTAYSYICWAGLVDYACPIVMNGQIVAVLFAGQRRLQGDGPGGRSASEYLDEGICRAARRLQLSVPRLKDLVTSSKVVTVEDVRNHELPSVCKAAQRVFEIAFERYRRKRDEIEHYFREEAMHAIESERETSFGVKRTDRMLSRLREFFHLRQAYFLLNDIDKLDEFAIVGKGTAGGLTPNEEGFRVDLKTGKLGIRDRISVFQLTAKPRYGQVVSDLRRGLGEDAFEQIWVATCPLPASANAFWLFLDPQALPGLRPTTSLTALDRHFLARFCGKVRDALSSAFATSLVMRAISHELGAKIAGVFQREMEIKLGKATGDLAKLYASRNLCQLRRYHHILENVRHIFIRRTRESYNFRREDIRKPLEMACGAFEGDPSMEARGVKLPPPVLVGDTAIEMDSTMLRMAFFNLVDNAIKYSFDDHFVEIKGRERRRPSRPVYEIQFYNFGVGILPEEIDHRLIFREDYRGLLSRDRHRTGSGLGLAIVEMIIRDHGGSVNAKSIAYGDLDRSRSQFASAVEDPRLLSRPDGQLAFGSLNIFTVTLPYRQGQLP